MTSQQSTALMNSTTPSPSFSSTTWLQLRYSPPGTAVRAELKFRGPKVSATLLVNSSGPSTFNTAKLNPLRPSCSNVAGSTLWTLQRTSSKWAWSWKRWTFCTRSTFAWQPSSSGSFSNFMKNNIFVCEQLKSSL